MNDYTKEKGLQATPYVRTNEDVMKKEFLTKEELKLLLAALQTFWSELGLNGEFEETNALIKKVSSMIVSHCDHDGYEVGLTEFTCYKCEKCGNYYHE